MPRTATPTPGKTSFVKEFLNDHPQGNTKDVNEAWQAAGFEGTISPTLVNKTRVKLTGKRRGYSKTAAKEKSAPRHAQNSNRHSRQDQLRQGVPQRQSPRQRQSGQRGLAGCRIRRDDQPTFVNKTRASLGLTGNLRGKTKAAAEGKATPTGKRLGRPRKEPTAAVTGQPRGRKSNRSLALTDLEADIDRLIFKVMGGWRPHRDRGFVETSKKAALRSVDPRLIALDSVN